MATLRYDGRRNIPKDFDQSKLVINILGVGPVKVGDTFEVDDARAAELEAKTRNIFSLIDKTTPMKSKAQGPNDSTTQGP